MILNGDPLDLVLEESVRRFNNPSMEMVTEYSQATLLHHHSIGISKAKVVSEIRGLTVQEIYQDPNGSKIADEITEELVEASLKVPIYIEFPASDTEGNFDEIQEKLAQGRFIVHLYAESAEEARDYLAKMRSVSSI